MIASSKAGFLVAAALLGACTTNGANVKTRAVSGSLPSELRGNDVLAYGRAQLALNNVGLALEAFRKAQRQTPADSAPIQAIGDCYMAMGRWDLAQFSYESALALAPHDKELLRRLARIFERQGDTARAATARADAEAEASIASGIGSVTVQLPKPRTVAIPPNRIVELMSDSPTSSQTSDIPRPRPIVTVAVPTDMAKLDTVRLERLTVAEVALITSGRSIWPISRSSKVAKRSEVKWVELQRSPVRPEIVVLNAARIPGAAASAQTILNSRGWRKVAVGNAPSVRRKSVVLYPRGFAVLGRRLASQFGLDARIGQDRSVVLLIGRDKAEALRPRRRV